LFSIFPLTLSPIGGEGKRGKNFWQTLYSGCPKFFPIAESF
jgi:hypothetical protein